tara:strand:+ start:86601 stop:87167 length:567 start_codon:yes stop_codon:yes gene_type:complete
MNKQYLSAQQLLADAYALAAQVFESGFRPNYIIGVWRGGTPVAIAVHELLHVLGVEADHFAIRTQSYSGIGQREDHIAVDGLNYLDGRLASGDALLLIDDVHDSGLSLQRASSELQRIYAAQSPEIRIATPYFKPGNNRVQKAPDYYLHETDDWLIFPHELEGLTLAEMRAHKPELAETLALLESRLQ